MRPAPLHALHAFESAARHGSYSLAAGELHVTHSAVSQQIRTLESMLGVPLFERRGRQMALTREGLLLFRRIQPALLQISRAVSEVGVLQRPPSITVTTLQSFANRWLLPRMARFQKLRPDVAVHIQASADLKDLGRGQADLAIRYGRGAWKGCHAEPLLEEWLFPVCSPAFNQGRLPQTAASLKRYRILRDDCQMEWNAWCRHAGVDAEDFLHEASYSDSNLMLGAAAAGQGIAIGRSALVSADLAAGRLVRVFDLIAPAPYSYHLVTPPGRKPSAHLADFMQWLRAEAAAFTRKEQRALGLE
ncbi:MAG TPA: transcriptional regulator GcvA [Noviherbaspirillum sp.]|uniref:transcriptional regulator GcvA n=1 Tax=Noviherbaspirillum sp. TaxID=1926288 RepID=UPI002D73D88E|nr:transcriptional regulator GcvA [Noviherbaspirillum sp.]HYD96319.1 transcriptional regulator GcvA [Noviherbaspirillum sp.]